VEIEEVLKLDEGPERTAALAAWLQGLFTDDAAAPVLVGGAAVELYTLGAYTTGDVDLVGAVTPGVARALKEAGFERRGRHWIHESAQVFVEFPGESLDPEEEALWMEFEGRRIRIISIEDLLVDRLGAWQYWQSAVDGVNALLLWRAQEESIDSERLLRRVAQAGWQKALQSLVSFVEESKAGDPTDRNIEDWARKGP
jgi:hypothetical protein